MPKDNPSSEVAVRQDTVAIDIVDKHGRAKTVNIPAEIAEAYPALGNMEELAELMEDVFGSPEDAQGQLTVGDLVTVKVPSADNVAYTVGDQPMKEFTAVVLLRQERRNYWVEDITTTGGGQAPDCKSVDMKTGYGLFGVGSQENPTGSCAACPMSQWSETADGKRVPPHCKPQVLVIALMEGMTFPMVVQVPPTSQKAFRQYWKNDLFMGRGLPLPAAVTRFGLVDDKSENGQKFKRMVFGFVEKLDADTKAAMMALGRRFQPMLDDISAAQARTEARSTMASAVREEPGPVNLGEELYDDEPASAAG